jgi:hypothetical protein
MRPEIFHLWVMAERILYKHENAPSHFSLAVWDVLNNICHDRWMGRGGTMAWPPRAPHLNPLNFYLRRHQNILVNAAPVDNEEAFHFELWISIRLSAITLASLKGCCGPWWDVSRRVLNLMEDILSTYYKCSLSAITHKLNVSGHML